MQGELCKRCPVRFCKGQIVQQALLTRKPTAAVPAAAAAAAAAAFVDATQSNAVINIQAQLWNMQQESTLGTQGSTFLHAKFLLMLLLLLQLVAADTVNGK